MPTHSNLEPMDRSNGYNKSWGLIFIKPARHVLVEIGSRLQFVAPFPQRRVRELDAAGLSLGTEEVGVQDFTGTVMRRCIHWMSPVVVPEARLKF